MEMARLIERSIQQGIPAIVEAGTGTGKTFGYLVPLVLSGRKAVISTGTKNLQEQVYVKDLAILGKATGLHTDAMIMKGRKNYLCFHRYHQVFSQRSLLPTEEEIKRGLDEWLKVTQFADRAELAWLPEDDSFWESLSASSDQCLGANCVFLEDCFLNRLRREAAGSRLIIVNHHLFFADLKVREGGFGEVLPRFQAVVFDEAHNIEEIATSHFGESLSTGQLLDFADEVERGIVRGRVSNKRPLKRHLNAIRAGSQQILSWFKVPEQKGRLDQETLARLWAGPGLEIRKALEAIKVHPDLMQPGDFRLQDSMARAADLNRLIEEVLKFKGGNWLNWYERRKRGLVIHRSPLDVSDKMNEVLYDHRKTVVFTSATLSTGGSFAYIRGRLGIRGEALEATYPSHYETGKQCLMYIPKDMPTPADARFGQHVAKRIAAILQRTAGRALVLFTSHYNMNLVYGMLEGTMPYALYRQGDAPKSVLLEAFRQDVHSVLLATGSFWQGVDVPGESLSCLIIDKLPFDSPADPLVSARIDAMRAEGLNPFTEYQLPSAIISLKQGLGRLIRKSSDRGVLAVLDTRILTSRYGKFFLASLPTMPVSHELSDISDFFGAEKGERDATETMGDCIQ
jgi:ATP-dependent DNA helicase DinG